MVVFVRLLSLNWVLEIRVVTWLKVGLICLNIGRGPGAEFYPVATLNWPDIIAGTVARIFVKNSVMIPRN